MTPLEYGIAGCVLLLVLLMSSMPVAFVMGIVGVAGFAAVINPDAAMSMMSAELVSTFSSKSLTVIPLFVFMGQVAFHSGISRRLFDAAYHWLGPLPGGMAMATVGACTGFGAICGSGPATAATMASVALPEMKRYGYNMELATGSVAAGGSLGMLIPPSVVFICYGVLTEQSIGKLLVAGMIPGILLAGAYAGTILVWVKLNPKLAPVEPQAVTWGEKVRSLLGVWEPLALFLIVMGGIYLGLFTPTEAGAVGATALLLVALAKRRLTWDNLVAALLESVRISVMVLFLVAGANVFSYFLALSTIPMQVAEWVAQLAVSRYLIHVVILFIYLFLGCFLDAISMMVLTMPVIFPVVTALNFDPIWFGVIAVLMMEAGLITPPMGLNIFTVAGVAKDVPVEEIFRGVMPFLLSIFFVAALITLFPNLALMLPKMMLR